LTGKKYINKLCLLKLKNVLLKHYATAVTTNPRPIFFKILKHSILHRECIDMFLVMSQNAATVSLYIFIDWFLWQEQRVFCGIGTVFMCSLDYSSKVMNVKTGNRAAPA